MSLQTQEAVLFLILLPFCVLILISNARKIWRDDDQPVTLVEGCLILLACFVPSLIMYINHHT